MANRTMGEIISTQRKEKGMTQRELAEKLNITDTAVSKWERDIACPDINTIPKLAAALDLSVDELLNFTPKEAPGHKGAAYLLKMLPKYIPLAMGVAVTVLAVLDELPVNTGFVLAGIGLFCLALNFLEEK